MQEHLITLEHFKGMLLKATCLTLELAQNEVREELPSSVIYRLAGGGSHQREGDIDFAANQLYVTGSFPRIIDIAVCGIKELNTVVWMRPSDHPTTNRLDQTWNQPEGSGPFKAIGLLLPTFIWERRTPFRLQDLIDAYTDAVARKA